MINKIFAVVVSLLVLGCSTNYSTTNQVDDLAYIQLQGNFLDTSLVIDDGAPILINEDTTETFTLEGKVVAKYPISTGKHTVKITRAGQVVVNRVIFVSNSNTFEVTVP